MEYALGFLAIGVIVALAAMSPGPDFAVVAKNALTVSRRAGIATSAGVTLGIAVHLTYLMLGIGVVISQSILLFSVIKYIGAAYLVYLGIVLLCSKGSVVEPIRRGSRAKSDASAFRDGFVTNVLNPKATLFFLALFTQVIGPETSPALQGAYAVEILAIAMSWFSILSYILTTPMVNGFVVRQMKWIERTMGAALIALGVKVAVSSNT